MRIKVSLLLFVLSMIVTVNSFAADPIPYVYNLENTGRNIVRPATTLPSAITASIISGMTVIKSLPDPFAWSADPKGINPARSTAFADWETHRQEILDQVYFYEIGNKPYIDLNTQVTASYAGSTLTVNVTVGTKTLTLTAAVSIPSGATNPVPMLIGMNSTGSLNSTDISSRGIGTINFQCGQVSTYSGYVNTDKYFTLYPDQNVDNTGQYAIWSWGVSRIIDGLYKLNGVLGSNTVDLTKLMVTGCSYAGKMALYAGALDERIALTVPQESGGGGLANWRFSQTMNGVENLGATNSGWFKNDMFLFSNANVTRLPIDHHQVVALACPRAMWATSNDSQVWLASLSCYVTGMAAKKVWDTFGIGDRFGFTIDTGHGHCSWPTTESTPLGYFLDKYMKGNYALSQVYTEHMAYYDTCNVSRWMDTWGTGTTDLAIAAPIGNEYHYLEAESYVSATNGTNFDVLNADTFALTASNKAYVMPKSGISFVSSMSRDSVANWLTIPFTVDKDSVYYVYGHVSGVDKYTDSFYARVDNGGSSTFKVYTGWYTGGSWDWTSFSPKLALKSGAHKVTFAIRHPESRLDRIVITNHNYPPFHDPTKWTIVNTGIDPIHAADGYSITNWTKSSNNKITIGFEIPTNNIISFEVYNMSGAKVAELVGKNYQTGKNTAELDAVNFAKGAYICTMKVNNFTLSKKMSL